ncbi:MAG: N-acetylmuramoyl-L-alanine amidase family protein [Myxococcaceae bacterium]
MSARVALLLLAALALASPAWARAPTVIIDPGHGGNQDGASSASGYREKNLALVLSQKLRAALVKSGAKVLLTREKDGAVQLPDRVAYAKAHPADLFISVHANSMPTQKLRESTHGIETFFLSANASGEEARKTAARENAEGPVAKKGPGDDTLAFILADLQRSEAHVDSSRLAYSVHGRLVEATGAADRGVQQAPFYVLMGVESPAILVEVGFISHPAEGKRLQDPKYQDRIVQALALGVQTFLEQVSGRDGKAEAATP